MPSLQLFIKIWICRSILRHSLTICVILNFSNNIVVEKPRLIRQQPKSHRIHVYWNIPTFQCDTHKLNFTALAEKYGIIRNHNDRFWGEKVNILYDPGNFPAILKNDTHTIRRNGGVPQEGNLSQHLGMFEDFLNRMIPDKSFSGIGIIDFESWRPIFRQNFGKLTEYKTLSISIEKQRHSTWSKELIEREAVKRFESSARKFMEKTLYAAKEARPWATWGYYAYPYCFNKSPNNMRAQCPKEVLAENDRLNWLFQEKDNFYPSIYLETLRFNATDKVQMIEGRIDESFRIMKKTNTIKNIIPYFWYKYNDNGEFVTKQDLFNTFTVLASYKIQGLIIWGSSNDVNSRKKCFDLYQYINDILGPLVSHNF